MGHVLAGLAAVGAILAAALSNQIADEFKAWTPWLTRRLIELWVSKLPRGIEDRDGENLRDRYREEWTRLIDDTPGQIGKLVEAASLFKAARHLKRRHESVRSQRQGQPSKAQLWVLYQEQELLHERVVQLEWQLFDLEMALPTALQSNGADLPDKRVNEVKANLRLARSALIKSEISSGLVRQ
jgi:hypothetical protein